MAQRSNEEWLADLSSSGNALEDALADLRIILLEGLRRGLTDWVSTAGPEFAPLSEDFVQEALLKILSNLGSFAGRSKFTTWAHKITVRVALTELRRKSWKDRSLDDMLSADTPFSRPFAANSPTPERMTERADMLVHLQRIIEEELTPKQREVMLLVPIGGMPISEAADRMGMKRNAMYKLLHDARLRLKKRLEADGLSADDIMVAFRS
jgi:RNA polymerase sigma-70 factor (ECF subfamily)